MDKQGVLLVLSGPSGCGKGTVLSEFLKRNPEVFVSISATTRAPRPGERDGEQYYFLTRDAFLARIESGGMLEYAEYCGNFYGTPKQQVFDKLSAGVDVILEIEVQGAMQVKEAFPAAVLVFIAPPSLQALEARLSGRQTESKQAIDKRLQTARREMRLAERYDYLILNDVVEDAAVRLEHVLCAEHFHTNRMKDFIDEVLKDE